MKAVKKPKYEKLMPMGVRESTAKRLREFCQRQRPRIPIGEAVTVAVEQWLERKAEMENSVKTT